MIDQHDTDRFRQGASIGPHGRILVGIDAQGPDRYDQDTPPEWALRTVRDRLRSAVISTGLCWPTGSIEVSGGSRRPGEADLAVLVAILRAAGADLGGAHDHFSGTVALDGQVAQGWRCTPIDAVWDLGALR